MLHVDVATMYLYETFAALAGEDISDETVLCLLAYATRGR